MQPRNAPQPSTGAALLGDMHPLLDQLGSTEGLLVLNHTAAALRQPQVQDVPTLARFLRAYYSELMLPVELPAIFRAHMHAARNQVRELIALDSEVAGQGTWSEFASASCRVGRSQLRKLKPLRDERLVQRFLRAVEQKQARGWHTLVYGITLAIYSLPVRQGLLDYARQTLGGFIAASARPLQLSELDCRALLDSVCTELPRHLDKLVRTLSPRETV